MMFILIYMCTHKNFQKSLTHLYLRCRSRKPVVICTAVKARGPGLVRIAFAEHGTDLYQEPLPHHVYYSPTKERIRFFSFSNFFSF